MRLPDVWEITSYVCTAIIFRYMGIPMVQSMYHSMLDKPKKPTVPAAPDPVVPAAQLEPEPVTRYSYDDILDNIHLWVDVPKELVGNAVKGVPRLANGSATFAVSTSTQYIFTAVVSHVEFGTYGLSVMYMVMPGPGNEAPVRSFWWDCKNDAELRTAVRRVWLLVSARVKDEAFIDALGGTMQQIRVDSDPTGV